MYLSLVDCWLLVVVGRVSNLSINEKINEMTMPMPGNLTARRDQTKGGQEWKNLRASRELDGDAQYNTLNRPDINSQRQSH
jgi:hypothetical protein